MAKRARIEDRVEARTRDIGEGLFARLASRAPSIFHGRWWEDRLIGWACEDEAVKVQLLRMLDVLPALRDHQAIAEHLEEYYQDVREHLPWAVRVGLDLSTSNTILSRALAYNARTNAARMARRFVAGNGPAEVLQTARRLRRQGLAVGFSVATGRVLSEQDADDYQHSCIRLIEACSDAVEEWPASVILDDNHLGPIPRLHVTVSLSRLDARFDAVDFDGSRKRVLKRLRPLLQTAADHHAFVQFAAERESDKTLAGEILREILCGKEFRTFTDVGLTVEAASCTAEDEAKDILKWVKKRKTPVSLLLTCGRHHDVELRRSEAAARASSVLPTADAVDAAFEQHSRFLMKNAEWLHPVLAPRQLRGVSHALAWADEYKVPRSAVEIALPFGAQEDLAQLLAEARLRVRLDCPVGPGVPTLSRLARHQLENLSDDTYLRSPISESHSVETLLMKPGSQPVAEPVEESEPFSHEPRTDFSVAENCEAMSQALSDARDEFGQTYPLVIDGKSSESRSSVSSRNPSSLKEIVGHVAAATADQAADAVEGARRTFAQWASSETSNRCEYVELIAAEIRERRFELAAWICLEVGMTWDDADTEVAMAIDYCMFYASEMRRLDVPQEFDLSGEENRYSYRPCGVAVVIGSWRSPLAALTGTLAAAIVAGNTVVLKPAEQSSVIAAHLMNVIRNAGVPDGVVNFLPGISEDICPELVGSPDVQLVCFNGDYEAGAEINRLAAETDHRQDSIRRVLAELGGNNAIIVDKDADLDDAVPDILSSAFAFAGQQAASCCRVIVLEAIHDELVERLVDAAGSLKLGAAEDPATQIGPVIDEDARKEMEQLVKSADVDADEEIVFAGKPGKLAKEGAFASPVIVTGIDPESNFAQQEIHGPLLSIIRVRNLDDAFAAANATRFALSGGVYSRSPSTLKRARIEFQVGNLSLNRRITDRMVQRQPFGGYRMSGTGISSGGPDYLLNFLIPVNVSENITRRGIETKKKRRTKKKA